MPETAPGKSPAAPPSDDDKDMDKQSKTPIVGYSGWYAGKVKGKLGKPEVHRNVLSRKDSIGQMAFMPTVGDIEVNSSTHNNNRERVAIYQDAIEQLEVRKITPDSLMKDISGRLEDKYPTTAAKHMNIKRLFENYDKNGSGLISDENFQNCLIRLNVVLPWAELHAILATFDRHSDGRISYIDFIRKVCPKAL